MPEVIDLTAHCPKCETPAIIARAMSGAGQTYVPDATVKCVNCATVYIASGAILSGSALPVSVYAVPTAGGDAGGLDAILLGDLPAPTAAADWERDENGEPIIPLA